MTVGVRLVHFLVALPILFGFMWFEGLRPAWSWLSVPLLVLIQFALTVGLAYPLAALNVRLRDTQHVVSVLLQMLMFLTPIWYSIDAVPERLRPWFRLSPLAALLEAWRAVILRGQWPDPASLAILAAIAAGALIAGQQLFIAHSHRFVDEL